MLAKWQREYTMEDILTQLKKEMTSSQNRKLVQPPEGALFKFPISIILQTDALKLSYFIFKF